jgi:hypothetical protein
MPSYGSLQSPSLQKHNIMDQRRGPRFNFGHIIGDPFALVTLAIGLVRNAAACLSVPILTPIACLVDRIRFLYHCRCSVAIPQLCMVGHCIHAVLHNRRHGRLCSRCRKHIQHCRKSSSISSKRRYANILRSSGT